MKAISVGYGNGVAQREHVWLVRSETTQKNTAWTFHCKRMLPMHVSKTSGQRLLTSQMYGPMVPDCRKRRMQISWCIVQP